MSVTRTKRLRLADIKIDGGTQMRAEIDQDVVADYAERLADLPPSLVYFDGSAYWLVDGFHRYYAHHAAQKSAMECQVENGTQRQAILIACGANHAHGLRRSNADKRKSVLALLNDGEWGKRSGKWISDQCNVSDDLVSEVRKEFRLSEPKVETKAGRQVNTANIGKHNTAQTIDDTEDMPDFETGGDEKTEGTDTKPEIAPTDPAGQTIPQRCLDTWNGRADVQELMRMIQRAKEFAMSLHNKSACKAIAFQHLESSLQSARSDAAFGMLVYVCPYCGARGDSCRACNGAGLVTKNTYENFTPDTMKFA